MRGGVAGQEAQETSGGAPPFDAAGGAEPAYIVQSADHALRLLRELVERGSLRVTDAAELLGVVPSTAHRLLGTLCHQGFASQEHRGGSYLPGPAVAAITVLRGDTVDLRSLSRAVLERLREETQETVSLLVLEGAAVHFVDSIDGPQAVRVSSRLGLSRPAHCTSGGKALLALLSREELRARYPTNRLVRRSPYSIGTRRQLEVELTEVRSRGYGWNFDEGDVGIAGVGVAIPDVNGGPLAAIALAAPTARLPTHEAVAALAGPVSAAAEELRNVLATRQFPLAVAAGRGPKPAGRQPEA